MLNMNSPTVQAMLANTPTGLGNIPMYYGNQPEVTAWSNVPTSVTGSAGIQTPYPSPKEMLTQGGQQSIYAPTSFVPRNIVGAYNPGYQAAFAGYSNPYMGYGTYSGYNNPNYVQLDQDAAERLQRAQMNGLSYNEQLENESSIYKRMSRTVSRNLGRSEEEALECEKRFDIYNKYPQQQEERKMISLHIVLKEGDKVVADINPNNYPIRLRQDYVRNANIVEDMKQRQEANRIQTIARFNAIYDKAIERDLDDVDMVDFFNDHAGKLMSDIEVKEAYLQSLARTGKLYNRDDFRKRLLENNGFRTKAQETAIDRFTGRYGVMPDGRPVSPGHDPAVASSFSYDPATGQYNVTAPGFIQSRLEAARESFKRSIDSN